MGGQGPCHRSLLRRLAHWATYDPYGKPKTVSDRAETWAFTEDIDAMLSPAERDAVITSIAFDPGGGDLISGAGGLRKRRIALPGRGKSGGARIITLYLGERFPVYAVFAYAKNERADLSPKQTRVLMRLVSDIKTQAQKRVKR